jgi:hypothetical protein
MPDDFDFERLVAGLLIEISDEDPAAYEAIYAVLAQEPPGPGRARRLGAALEAHPRAWDLVAAAAAWQAPRRGPGGLPGDPAPLARPEFHCPQRPCPVRWFRRTAGQAIPSCPTHHATLIPAPDQC